MGSHPQPPRGRGNSRVTSRGRTPRPGRCALREVDDGFPSYGSEQTANSHSCEDGRLRICLKSAMRYQLEKRGNVGISSCATSWSSALKPGHREAIRHQALVGNLRNILVQWSCRASLPEAGAANQPAGDAAGICKLAARPCRQRSPLEAVSLRVHCVPCRLIPRSQTEDSPCWNDCSGFDPAASSLAMLERRPMGDGTLPLQEALWYGVGMRLLKSLMQWTCSDPRDCNPKQIPTELLRRGRS